MTISKQKEESVKQEILRNAEVLFKKWGFAKTTMEDIAKESGKAKSTLYHYYKNKNEVFEDFVISKMTQIMGNVELHINKKPNAVDKIKEFVITGFKELLKETNLYSVLVYELKKDNVLLQSILANISEKEIEIVNKIILDGIKSGEFRKFSKDVVHLISDQIVKTTRNLQITAFIDEEKINTKKVKILADLLVNGIAKKE